MLNITKSVNLISNVLFQKMAILPTWRNFWFQWNWNWNWNFLIGIFGSSAQETAVSPGTFL